MGRRLGQHFLRDSSVVDRIARAVCPERQPLVVEIGPGEGVLTEALARHADRVIAVELDAPLIDPLRRRLPSVEVVEADVLEVDLAQWGPAVIVGNLPYYITSPIVDRILSLGTACRWAVPMMQKEVAERLCATPGSRDYGYLTVTTQSRADVETLFDVRPGAFRPPPKVDSAVVRLTPLPDPAPAEFLEFAGRCFRHKRKTLRNNLLESYPAIASRPEAGLRAEQLSISQLRSLFDALS